MNNLKSIDASGKTLGRVASEAAHILIGKDQASFERHKYSGSPLEIVNASKIKITPKKLDSLIHSRYSGIPGGLRQIKGTETVKTKGFRELLRLAIYRMLPSNKLQREMLKNLKIKE